MKKSITLLILGIMLTACISSGPIKLYSGPNLNESEVSTISCGYFVKITAIDDKPLSKVKEFCSYDVLPGNHTVTFQNFKRAGNNRVYMYDQKYKIKFTTKKSRKYTLQVSYPDDKRNFFLYETDRNGKVTQENVKYKETKI